MNFDIFSDIEIQGKLALQVLVDYTSIQYKPKITKYPRAFSHLSSIRYKMKKKVQTFLKMHTAFYKSIST